MKLNNRIALTLALSVALCSASALAQDTADAPAAAPAPHEHHHHHKAGEEKVSSGGKYENCVKQKMAVAEYFCSVHADTCQAEKAGVAPQCRSEARGERQKG
jgi:hypothetical protein